MRSLACLATLALMTSACTATRPCTNAGDLSWPGAIKGDRICQQKYTGSRWVNHGKYVQKHLNGKIAIQGFFQEGRKHGPWFQFDERGEKILERVYDNGVEVSSRNIDPPSLRPY